MIGALHYGNFNYLKITAFLQKDTRSSYIIQIMPNKSTAMVPNKSTAMVHCCRATGKSSKALNMCMLYVYV